MRTCHAYAMQVYTDLGCSVSRIAAGAVEERAAMLLAQCGLN